MAKEYSFQEAMKLANNDGKYVHPKSGLHWYIAVGEDGELHQYKCRDNSQLWNGGLYLGACHLDEPWVIYETGDQKILEHLETISDCLVDIYTVEDTFDNVKHKIRMSLDAIGVLLKEKA